MKTLKDPIYVAIFGATALGLYIGPFRFDTFGMAVGGAIPLFLISYALSLAYKNDPGNYMVVAGIVAIWFIFLYITA